MTFLLKCNVVSFAFLTDRTVPWTVALCRDPCTFKTNLTRALIYLSNALLFSLIQKFFQTPRQPVTLELACFLWFQSHLLDN